MTDEHNSRLAEARATARELVDLLEGGKTPIDTCLMKALRLARLLRDTDAKQWLQFETKGYPAGFSFKTLGTCEGYARFARQTEDNKYWVGSLPELEAAVAASERSVATSQVPTTPTSSVENHIAASATERVIEAQEKSLNRRALRHQSNRKIYSALKAGLHAYASETLIALELGDEVADLFQDARTAVDVFVRATCPQAAEQLLAMNERLSGGGAEDLAAALTSCRRLLRTVADSVFPSREEPFESRDGKTRKVGADEYKNRLLAFLDSNLESDSSRAMVSSDLEHLAARLDAVYEKACKGVHDDVTVEEARLAVVHTYLFIAEVARVASQEPGATTGATGTVLKRVP